MLRERLKREVRGGAIKSAAIFKKKGSKLSGPAVFLGYNLVNASWTTSIEKGEKLKGFSKPRFSESRTVVFTVKELVTESNREPQDKKCSLKQFNMVALSIVPDAVVKQGGSSLRISPVDNDCMAFQNVLGLFRFFVVTDR